MEILLIIYKMENNFSNDSIEREFNQTENIGDFNSFFVENKNKIKKEMNLFILKNKKNEVQIENEKLKKENEKLKNENEKIQIEVQIKNENLKKENEKLKKENE